MSILLPATSGAATDPRDPATEVRSPGSQTPASPAPDAHQHLRDILDRPLFRAWRDREEAETDDVPSVGRDANRPSWFDDFSKRVDDFFTWLFRGRLPTGNRVPSPGSMSALPGVLKTIAYVILAVGGVFLILLLVKAFTQRPRGITTARVLSRQQIRDALESGDALVLGAADWMSEADRLAAEQDFRAVYRALYLALLSGLHTAGKIEHTRTRTNWTYVNRYRGPAAERQTFGDLTTVFDRVWYGRLAADGDDIADLQRKVATLVNTPPEPAAASGKPLGRGAKAVPA